MTLAEWSLAGHVLGTLVLALVAWWGRRHQTQAAQATALFRGAASAIDRGKNVAHAEHDVRSAQTLKGVTTMFAGEASAAGLRELAERLLSEWGLNAEPKLRTTTHPPAPEGHPHG